MPKPKVFATHGLFDAARQILQKSCEVQYWTKPERPPREEVLQQGKEKRSEEHTSELQSPCNLVCRLLLEKKKAKDLQRHAWRRKAKPMGDAPPPEVEGKALPPGDSLENKETLERLRKALHALRPEEKEVF